MTAIAHAAIPLALVAFFAVLCAALILTAPAPEEDQ